MSAALLGEHLEAGPFSLAMSSGFFGFYAHAGMLAALTDAGLSPARLSGSSAGALVAACWASGLEPPDLAAELRALRREHFWDPGPGAGLLKGRLFRARLEALLQPRFDRLRAPVSVSVHDIASRATVVVDDGELPVAVHASCAVPLMFHPVRLGGRWVVDGGVSDRPGLAGLPEGERTLFHHLGSRSPWRRRGSPALRIPARRGMVALVVDGLPRVDPFRLPRGPIAYRHAREATARALERPIVDGVVRVGG